MPAPQGAEATRPPAASPRTAPPSDTNLGTGDIRDVLGLDALYEALAAGRERLARGHTLVLRSPAIPSTWGVTLVCTGARETGLPGGQPLCFASCDDLLRAARRNGLDRFLGRRGFALQEDSPGSSPDRASRANPSPANRATEALRIEPLERTLGLVDLHPVAGSLVADPRARSLLLLVEDSPWP